MKERFQQLGQAYRIAVQADPRLNLWLALSLAVPVLLGVVVSILLGGWAIWPPAGLLVGLLVGMFIFGRRVQSAQFSSIEGIPGAAAAVLQNMRGQWFVVPAVAFNKQQEMVHRVVGRAGIILVAEGGSGQRVKGLVAQTRKKLNRVRGETPIHVIYTGDGTGDTVSLDKLQIEMSKLKAVLDKTEVPKLARKLAPLDKGNIPMPKGAIPRGGRPR